MLNLAWTSASLPSEKFTFRAVFGVFLGELTALLQVSLAQKLNVVLLSVKVTRLSEWRACLMMDRPPCVSASCWRTAEIRPPHPHLPWGMINGTVSDWAAACLTKNSLLLIFSSVFSHWVHMFLVMLCIECQNIISLLKWTFAVERAVKRMSTHSIFYWLPIDLRGILDHTSGCKSSKRVTLTMSSLV